MGFVNMAISRARSECNQWRLQSPKTEHLISVVCVTCAVATKSLRSVSSSLGAVLHRTRARGHGACLCSRAMFERVQCVKTRILRRIEVVVCSYYTRDGSRTTIADVRPLDCTSSTCIYKIVIFWSTYAWTLPVAVRAGLLALSQSHVTAFGI